MRNHERQVIFKEHRRQFQLDMHGITGNMM